MAIMDKLLLLADDQEVTVTFTGAAVDLTSGGNAVGHELNLCARVTDGVAGGAVAVTLQTSEDGDDWVDILTSPEVPAAQLAAGATLFEGRIPKVPATLRYIRAVITPAATLTSGKFSVFLTSEL